MLTILFLLWSLLRGLRNPRPKTPVSSQPPSPEAPTPSPEAPKSQTPSPEPEIVSEMSSITRMSSESRASIVSTSRYSPFSRDSSVDVGNESRPSVTSISSFSTSSRRYEIIGQRSIDSRASVTSLWSSDTSRRDSEAIPEHEIDSSDSRTSFASASSVLSSEGSRRLSEAILARRRRSSARSSQVRRHTRRFPLTYDRRRTTGRFVEGNKMKLLWWPRTWAERSVFCEIYLLGNRKTFFRYWVTAKLESDDLEDQFSWVAVGNRKLLAFYFPVNNSSSAIIVFSCRLTYIWKHGLLNNSVLWKENEHIYF